MGDASFPADFLWGISGAALCVEGAAGDRAETIWEPFCRKPGAVRDGTMPGQACDQVSLWDQDLEILRRLGVNAYRFSISWARVLGSANSAGLDYYQRVADSLLAAGIRPLAVLYHWDLPQVLEEDGGWRNRDTARRFADHAAVVYRALGDRIGTWITHHDPWASAFHGYGSGSLAPGRRSEEEAVGAAHVLLLSHALALQACAPLRRPGSSFGVALGLSPVLPATPEDEEAAFWADCYLNCWCLDPLLRGGYPEELLQIYTREPAADRHRLGGSPRRPARVVAAPGSGLRPPRSSGYGQRRGLRGFSFRGRHHRRPGTHFLSGAASGGGPPGAAGWGSSARLLPLGAPGWLRVELRLCPSLRPGRGGPANPETILETQCVLVSGPHREGGFMKEGGTVFAVWIVTSA
jgi:hypothetical protein